MKTPQFLLLIHLFFAFNGLAQDNYRLPEIELPQTRGYERDPLTLVNKLTENAKSEKEKFDLIFTWVVKNIKYDYRNFSSSKGIKSKSIQVILRKKKGLCGDYAKLMDTLCALTGIESVAITGYVKEELFDVQDSIYFENHVWNAVKLNHNWYLFDITWSSGQYEYELNWRSQRIYNWMLKLSMKRKVKTIHFKTKKISDCALVKRKISYKYEKLPFLNNVLINLLQRINLKYKRVFKKVSHDYYYLTQPEVFSITHVPNNPYWSLDQSKTAITNYETDSSYFHLDRSNYENQIRIGSQCQECDAWLRKDSLSRPQELKQNSKSFNPKNTFTIWTCDYDLSLYYQTQAKQATDSASKVALFDSTLTYLTFSRIDLSQSLKTNNLEFNQHKKKNKEKLKFQVRENQTHYKSFYELKQRAYRNARANRTLNIKNHSLQKYLRSQNKKLLRTKISYPTNSKPKEKEEIEDLKQNVSRSIEINDSLANQIESYMKQFEQLHPLVAAQLWQTRKSTLASSFYRMTILRYYGYDEYDKNLKLERLKLENEKEPFIQYLNDSIFTLSDTVIHVNYMINKLLKEQNKNYFKTNKYLNQLVRERIITIDSLKQFQQTSSQNLKEVNCWFINNELQFEAIYSGYYQLAAYTDYILRGIRYDNLAEKKRFKQTQKELTRRKTKRTNAIKSNFKLVQSKRYYILKLKKEYLKELKSQAKKEI